MHGAASWDQIVFIAGIVVFAATVIVAAAIFAGRMVYKFTEILKTDRHTLENNSKQRDQLLEEMINEYRDAYEDRLRSIETFNAGLVVVLRELESFKSEVKEQFEKLNDRRHEDMMELHKRIAAITNHRRS